MINFGYYGPEIKPSNNLTHVGLHFQFDANWKLHILCTYEKACKRLNILCMLKYSLPRDSLIKTYTSFITPVLEYGYIVWDNCNQREETLLEEIQVTSARIITGLRVNYSRKKQYNELGWESICVKKEVHWIKIIL